MRRRISMAGIAPSSFSPTRCGWRPQLSAARDPATNGILDPVRLLTIAMLHTASVQDEARQDRWQHVMGALVELVRTESRALRDAKRAAEEGR
jgi:hypothetical protein